VRKYIEEKKTREQAGVLVTCVIYET